MRRLSIKVVALIVLCGSIYPQAKKADVPPPVSSNLPALPPPPDLESPAAAPAPPPPANGAQPAPPPVLPAAVYPKHFELVLDSSPALQGVYQDFQLPPGDLSVKWTAIGPGQVNISSQIDVTVLSPQLCFRSSPTGGSQVFIPVGGGNMRVIARRKTFAGAFRVFLSIDLGQPQ